MTLVREYRLARIKNSDHYAVAFQHFNSYYIAPPLVPIMLDPEKCSSTRCVYGWVGYGRLGEIWAVSVRYCKQLVHNF